MANSITRILLSTYKRTQTDPPGLIHFLNIVVLLINLSELYDKLAKCKGTIREMTFHKGQGNVREFRTMVNISKYLCFAH